MPDTERPHDSRVMDQALQLVAAVEAQSALLRSVGGPPRQLSLRDRLAVHLDVDPTDVPFPLGALGRLTAREVRADVVLVSRNPTRRIRLRALYLGAGIAVAMHGRLPFHRAVRLLHGADIARRLAGAGGLAIPDELERGRRLRHAWVAEALLDGKEVRPDQWDAIAGRLADGIVDLWRHEPIRIRPFRHAVERIDAGVFRQMIDDMDLTIRRPDEFARVVAAVTASEAGVLVGTTHGDPIPGNVLQLADQRLGLVDWEKADIGPLGIDAARMALHVDDPLALLQRIEHRLPPIRRQGTAPWIHQVGGVLASLLPVWHAQMKLWPKHRQDRRRERLTHRLRVAERLLTGS